MAKRSSNNRAAAETLAALMGLRLDASGRCTFRLKEAPGTLVQVRVVDVPKCETEDDGDYGVEQTF
ncbi:MAG: hypothetical protein LUD72_13800 [Bacteroidales bacterium]|nr:hypothetical protein [Bacteroidales bacterium]